MCTEAYNINKVISIITVIKSIVLVHTNLSLLNQLISSSSPYTIISNINSKNTQNEINIIIISPPFTQKKKRTLYLNVLN